ncbi:MAG: altronate dehydratase [Clostridia bacterium]|nr:altronate dehydratase [Clostridia bacterium]
MDHLKINAKDNVAVALAPLRAGEERLGVVLKDDIKRGHKFALSAIAEGENVIKYGSPIGRASAPIAPGEHVHTHNVKTNLCGVLEYEYEHAAIPPVEGRKATFLGFRRKDGRVGIRNEIWIVPTVGCVNEVAEAVAAKAREYIGGSVSAVCAFTHPFGCSQLGDDHLRTQKALAGLVRHPNAGGVLVLGLGCENNNIGRFRAVLGETDPERVRFLNCQDVEDEEEEALAILKELCDIASRDEREEAGSDELVVGLKCGGSDGLSGITANPCVGAFSDLLIGGGGSAILTEVPEMFGAEQLLMNRCESRELFDRTVAMINGFKEYFIRYGQPVYENPSPGNIEGGITTLEDKSLGCTEKSGSTAVRDVLGYGDPVKVRGLSLLNAPGNDLVASTSLAVSGAQLVLFTTGRGTPFGSPVPTVKISSNSALAEKKSGWIDFDAGIITETGDVKGCGEALFEYVMKLASGEILTKNEETGKRGISIFKDGVTL